MRVHITSINGFQTEDEIANYQKSVAEIGAQLGYTEMCFYRYPVEADTKTELGKRLDGIIGGVSKGDIVITQMPSGNGEAFDQLLYKKLKAYGAKLIQLFSDEHPAKANRLGKARNVELPSAEVTILPGRGDQNSIQNKDSLVLFYDPVRAEKKEREEEWEKLARENYVKSVLSKAVSLSLLGPEENAVKKTQIPSNAIHVCFGLYDKTGKYSKNVGATMNSVMNSCSRPVVFHILGDESVSFANRENLRMVAEKRDHYFFFHDVGSYFEKFDVDKYDITRFSRGMLFRLVIPDVLLNLSKAIYLDADMLVNRDLAELWNTDIGAYALAVVHDHAIETVEKRCKELNSIDIDPIHYFNSGLLYMNLDRIRAEGCLFDRSMELLNGRLKTSEWPDQDALNYLFRGKTLELPSFWNSFRTRDSLDERIIHYAGGSINLTEPSPIDKEYIQDYIATPWGGEAVYEMYEKQVGPIMWKVNALQKALTLVNSKQIKKRIYCNIAGSKIEARLLELFPISENDYFISEAGAANLNDFEKQYKVGSLEDLRKENKDEVLVLFRPVGGDGEISKTLKDLGYEEGENYLNIMHLLKRTEGGYV